MKKIIILHDTFLYKGGGERLIIMIAKILNTDIASGFFSSGSFDLRKEGFKGKMISISSEIFKKGFRHIKLKLSFLFKTKFISNYDIIIFSGDSISAVRNCNKNQKKIYYCHTPPRYLYDLHNLYCQKVSFFIKPFFKIFCFIFKYMYEKDIKKMDLIFTNSKNTQNRIKKYLNVDSIVLYPPVDLDVFKYNQTLDYYLSFARLADVKRVDFIVKAFLKIPNKKLIVIYGENDPSKEKIFEIAKNAKNIEFITLPGNIGFNEYISNCIATIYIPINEDFGMSPVESMASGKPVIGVNEGGLKETINEKTGILLKENFDLNDLIDAINFMSKEKSISMRKDCENKAKYFSIKKFDKKLKDILGLNHDIN